MGLAMRALGTMANAYYQRKTGDQIVDSSVLRDICGDANIILNVPEANAVSVTIADGTTKRTFNHGAAVLTVQGPRGATQLTIHDVLVLPGMAMSLFMV